MIPVAHSTPESAAATGETKYSACAETGGGTRAVAYSYGVLLELRDTEVIVGGQKRRLIDKVDLTKTEENQRLTEDAGGVNAL